MSSARQTNTEMPVDEKKQGAKGRAELRNKKATIDKEKAPDVARG
jgi:hypothetical protein